MAVFRVEKKSNYTVMSNHHLSNKQLSLKAIGLMSLMLSLPESWDYTLNGLAIIAKDGINSIRGAIKELEEQGYLVRHRNRNELGQLTDTEYIIREEPLSNPEISEVESVEPSPQSPEPEIGGNSGKCLADVSDGDAVSEPICGFPTLDKPTLDSPILEKPTYERPTYENRTQLNTYIANKYKANTQAASIHPSIYPSRSDEADEMMDRIESFRNRIKQNLEYDILVQQYSPERLDGVINLIVETLMSNRQFIQVNCEDVPANEVKNRLESINPFHVEYLFEKLDSTTTRIRNIRAYMLTALYNAPSTMDADIRARIREEDDFV